MAISVATLIRTDSSEPTMLLHFPAISGGIVSISFMAASNLRSRIQEAEFSIQKAVALIPAPVFWILFPLICPTVK